MRGKKLLITVLVVFIFMLMAVGSSEDEGSETLDESQDETVEEERDTEEPEEVADETEEEVEEDVSMGKQNALRSAKNYLSFSAFSKEGLIDQLDYEGYSHEEAVYAVDNCGADWNKQAALKAENYLDFSSFSREGLIEQLEYEGFTREQAEYGVEAVGY